MKKLIVNALVLSMLISSTGILSSCSTEEHSSSSSSEKFIQKSQKVYTPEEILAAKKAMDEECLRIKSLILEKGREITEAEAEIILTPSIEVSHLYLNTLGFTDDVLMEELGINSIQSPAIAGMGIMLNDYDNQYVAVAQGGTWDLIVDCAVDASGIAGVALLLQAGIKQAIKDVGLKGVAKIMGKFFSKYLGYVGTAIAIIDFVECVSTGD